MKRHFLIGLVALGAVFAGALQQATQRADEEVTGTYSGDDGSKVELLGVCSIAPDKVDCWGRDCVRSPGLAKQVQGALTGGGSGEVYFRYGRKNRMILMRASKGVSPSYSPNGGSGVYWGADDGGRVSGISIWAAAADKTAEIVATIQAKSATIDMPLKVGEKAVLDDVNLEIGPTAPGKAPQSRYPYMMPGDNGQAPLGKFWAVILGLTQSESAYYNLTCTALDKDRNPIRYVDLNGEPISAVRYLALGGTSDGGFYGPTPGPAKGQEKPRAAKAIVQQNKTAVGAMQLAVNINPERIAYLRVTKPRQKRVLFKGIPLDPKE